MISNDDQNIFFQRIGSMCTHMEETLGTDMFVNITLHKVTVNPVITIPSTVMYLNNNGKLKILPNFNFPLSYLRKDEWGDIFINKFQEIQPNCKLMIGVLTSYNNINWYIDFVTNTLCAPDAIERTGQGILL